MPTGPKAQFARNFLAGIAFLLLGLACLAGYGLLRFMVGGILALPALLVGIVLTPFGVRSIIRAFNIAAADQSAISI